jgi:DNA-binding SARP family transcriptional activator/predicted ATPase
VVSETRLLLLGAPAVEHDGASTPLLNERRFQLLAYLAFSGDWVDRDRLAGLLWPEHEHAAARRNLRKIVFRARESPWAAGLQTQGERLRWVVRTDLADFRQALAAGRLADASVAYRGPLLMGLDDPGNSGYSAWLNAHRASLHAQWRDAASAALPTLSTPEQRATAARRLTDDDPLDERALLAALAVLTTDGKRVEAQALYRGHVHRLAEELGVEPSATLRAAAQSLLQPQPAAAADTPSNSAAGPVPTPPPRGGFVGRRTEQRELRALLQRPGCRVITILGPGGIGKSRFAREQLAELAATHTGVHWVALEDIGAASQLLARIARVLGASVNDASDVIAQIAAGHAHEGALLVLDNAEHLEALAGWLQPLLAAWPSLRLLITSRARVGLPDEWLLPLSGLAVPDAESRDLEAAAAFDAVRMFDLRARTVSPGFDLAAHLGAVIAIVERVDGMPLAIEMAAAWVRLLPPAEILRELAHSIDILQLDASSGPAATRPEHASMEAVFRRSWDLLAPSERRALSTVTVFRGGFRREAAAAVAAGSFPVLASLVDKSLLAVDAHGRFGMHPLIAAWAATTAAAEPPPSPPPALRHAEFFAGWLDALGRDGSADSRSFVRAVEPEFSNCEAAWRAALRWQRSDLVAAMRPAVFRFAENQGRWREAGALLAAALASDALLRGAPTVRLDLLLDLASVHFNLGDLHQCEAFARTALALARDAGAADKLIGALNNLGIALLNRGEAAQALPLFIEAAERARSCGERGPLGTALLRAAIAHKTLGDIARCLALNEEALEVMREIGNDNGVAIVLNNLGDTLRQSGDYVRAREVLETGLHFAQERGLLPRLQNFRLCLGVALFESGHEAAGRELLLLAVEGCQRAGQYQVEVTCMLRLALLDLKQGDTRACLQRCRDAFARARARGFDNLALQALSMHADLHLAHGDRAYAGELLALLERSPRLSRSEREHARARREAADAQHPRGPADPSPHPLDLADAEARLKAPFPGIAG